MNKNTDYLNEIKLAIKNNNGDLSELLLKSIEDKELKYDVPCLYVEWLKSGAENPMEAPCLIYSSNLNALLNTLDKKTEKMLLEVLSSQKEEANKRQLTRKALYELITLLQSNDNKVIAAIRPTEWYNAIFVNKDSEDVLPHYLLHHFMEAKETATGMFDEYWGDFDKPLNDYLQDNFSYLFSKSEGSAGADLSNRNKFQYFLEEDLILGKACRHNLEILNLDEVFFETAKKGILAAKKFC